MSRYLPKFSAPKSTVQTQTSGASSGAFYPQCPKTAVGMQHAVRTDKDWELRPSPRNASLSTAQFWMGAEIPVRTFFIVECIVNVDRVAQVKYFVAATLEMAKLYLEEQASASWYRILVRLRGSADERCGWKLEELREVYHCERTGAFVYALANGEEMYDETKPATDARGIQHLNCVYSTTRQ